MLTLYVCAVALVAVILGGGDIRQLAGVRISHVWLVWVALADQVVVISVIPNSHPTLLSAAHLASYAAAGVCLLLNRRLPGILLIALGAASNGLAIALNGGTLPASPAALRASGWRPSPGHFHNSAALPHPRLSLLGDIFATPAWLPGHDVFSVGDIAICIGVLWFLWRTCRPAHPTSSATGSGDVAVAAERAGKVVSLKKNDDH